MKEARSSVSPFLGKPYMYFAPFPRVKSCAAPNTKQASADGASPVAKDLADWLP